MKRKQNLMKRFFISAGILIITFGCVNQSSNEFTSPGENVKIELDTKNGALGFTALYNADSVFLFSPLGMKIGDEDISIGSVIKVIKKGTVDETWPTVNGKFREIRDHHNEYEVICESPSKISYSILIRCYDDGFAYRYVFPEQEDFDSISIRGETTELNFKDDFTYWAHNGENHNLGPFKKSDQGRENLMIPVVVKTVPEHYIGIHEAEIVRYAPFSINAGEEGNKLGFNVRPTKDKLPVKTSWRSFIIGDKAGDLPESNLLVNLNEPCKIEDTSWIKPGNSLWDWRVWGYKASDGFEYGLNTVSHKRMIDFAAENNIQYLLIDADWYGDEFNEDSDPTNAREGINIEECMTYAKEKGIGVILYLNDVGAKKFGLNRVLKQFHDWGAVGVKYGFMRDEDMEQKVRHTREVVKLCAKYRLMVNFHDNPIPPSGDRRTWPNLVTKEFGHAQADAKKSCYPETFVNQVFINQIAGPLDYTNGWFDLNGAKGSRMRVFEEIPATLAAEVAKTIAIYTGWNVLPDAPEAYQKYDDLFDCIRQIPSQFDSYKVLDGELDQFASVARQAGEDWFVGTVTNRDARVVEIDFNFLPEDKKYSATFYEDAADSHFVDNRESYTIREIEVDSNTKLKVNLAAGGGNSIWLKKN